MLMSRFLLAMSEGGSSRALHRLKQLKGVLSWQPSKISVRLCSSGSSEEKGYTVDIGGTLADVTPPKNPHLVPTGKLPSTLPQSLLQHLKWMLQKDSLGQDMFLIGPPGPTRRQLAMAFCELLQKEVEYVSLSRDTTESDLKQRREIRQGSAEYINQSAVRAALAGRVLVLEGVEKAERNVLPVLNNLLENREMLLEDGRFLVAPERYDKLLKTHSQSAMNEWKLERVHEKFRVIALGLPVPPYRGNPLDPPLRSRFQARVVPPPPYQEQLQFLQSLAPDASRKKLSAMLSVAATLQSLSGSTNHEVMDFPLHHLEHLAKILRVLPDIDVVSLLQLALPAELLGKQEVLIDAAKKFGESPATRGGGSFYSISRPEPKEEHVEVSLSTPHSSSVIELQGYPHLLGNGAENSSPSSYIPTAQHNDILAAMFMTHSVGDFCIVGGKGTGKTTLAHHLASLLGYSPETIVFYQDQTSRDLLQQRVTLPSGDTSWRLSPLVRAALEGRCAVLDGLHRGDIGTLAVLKRLIHDRELSLFGGERLVSQSTYDDLKRKTSCDDQGMKERGIYPISDKFRMIALAEPPVLGGAGGGVMSNPEFLSMFLFHHLKPLSIKEEKSLIASKVPNVPEKMLDQLLLLVSSLRTSQDQMAQSLSSSLSTRQLLRVCRRLAVDQEESLYRAVHKSCLSRFLPSLAKSTLEKAMEDTGIVPTRQLPGNEVSTDPFNVDSSVKARSNPSHKHNALVPDVLFYDNQQHTAVMKDMMSDFSLGEHLLLVGNQGVGKNKIVDRFLHLLNLPREYLQLHRDTTVQTLTLQSSVRDGQIVYEDSPLVRAVREGLVLVVDEADKAPTHVTCVLKNLIERGEMTLTDGRRIVPGTSPESLGPNSIPVHPDFRMIVLANRPGFPFLGNDFFAAMGDMFSCHAIDNPDFESELTMMKRYGPDVPEATLRKLVKSFAELREMADSGLISYPYSTREVVNVVRHLQSFPNEPIANIVHNVFSFDSYDKDLVATVAKTLHKHGIPVGGSPARIQLAEQKPLPKLKLTSKLRIQSGTPATDIKFKAQQMKLKGPHQPDACYYPLEKMESRGVGFSETKTKWLLPMEESSYVTGLATGLDVNDDDVIHVATGNPLGLYSMALHGPSIHHVDLGWYFPLSRKPILSVAALHGNHSGKVLLHERNSNGLVVVEPRSGQMWILDSDSLTGKISKHLFNTSDQRPFKMLNQLARDNLVILHEDGGAILKVLDFNTETVHELSTPMNIVNLVPMSGEQWMIEDDNQRKYLLTKQDKSSPVPNSILELTSDPTSSSSFLASSTSGPPAQTLSSALNMEVDDSTPTTYSRLVCSHGDAVALATGFPMKAGKGVSVFSTSIRKAIKGAGPPDSTPATPTFIPEHSQIVVPATSDQGEGVVNVIDLGRHTHSAIPLQRSQPRVQFWPGDHRLYSSILSDSSIVVADAVGNVVVMETGYGHLQKSLEDWKRMIGSGDGQPLQLTVSRDSGKDVSSPKHGKVDPSNDPHTGGNTWAGGTGGRDTAGLGGKGGPYRLDSGHNVFQVSDQEKEDVPEEVKRAAREMGQKAFQKRLQEIKMSPHDAELYAKLKSGVQNQIHSIRVVLEGLQARGLERQWIKHQTYGDLDDSKLIDGLTGERSIYKRRGEKEPEYGSPQLLPKRIKLVVDVSGSMYRFNGHDRRLDRMISALLMVMEAFHRHDDKFKIDIVGHSGDSPDIKFVSSDTPPANDRERLTVLETMHAHSQFCWTGDHTLEATKLAVESITTDPADEYFVVVVSDANFSRYGIRPKDFAKLMTKDPKVNVFAIFIGSLGDQADILRKSLPGGRTFICLDNRELPQILQQVFTATFK